MKVSIIIPVYNARNYIERTIKSIKEQTYKDLEIIIIDDGSTDGSYEICEKSIGEDKRFCIYKKENGGVSSARNFGLSKATGKYISFVDADDYIDNNTIEDCVKIINKYNVDIVKFNYIKEIGRIKKRNKRIVKSDSKFEYPFNSILCNIFKNDCFCSSCECLILGEIAKNNIFLEEIKLGEDFLYFVNCLLKSKSIYITNKNYYHYIVNSSSATHTFSINNSLYVLKNIVDVCEILKKNIELNTDIKLDYNFKIIRNIIDTINLSIECGTKEEVLKYIDLLRKDKILNKFMDNNINLNTKSLKFKIIFLKIKIKKIIKRIIQK